MHDLDHDRSSAVFAAAVRMVLNWLAPSAIEQYADRAHANIILHRILSEARQYLDVARRVSAGERS